MRWLRILPLVGAWIMLGFSGAYVGIYLYRWEWNRALIAGVFFLVAQVFVSTVVILRRLGALEERLDSRQVREAPPQAPGEPDPDEADVTEELDDALTPRTELPWLRDGGDQYGVFIPILLGAGVVLSALAWLVERAATASAAFGRSRRRAHAGTGRHEPDPERPGTRLAAGLGVLALVVVAGLAVDQLGDLTQTRPDVPMPGWETVITLEVDTRPGVDEATGAADLWAACRHLLGDAETEVVLRPDAALSARVTPAVGQYLRRQLLGCLEDATIDHVQGRVETIEDRPPA